MIGQFTLWRLCILMLIMLCLQRGAQCAQHQVLSAVIIAAVVASAAVALAVIIVVRIVVVV